MEREPTRAYIEACLPDTVILLRQRLLPFSLGHYKILLRLDNWFIRPRDQRPSPVPHLGDLLWGVWVCCQTYEEAIAGLDDPKLPRKIIRWGKVAGQFDFGEIALAFGQYISEAMRWPETHEPERADRIPGAPFVQRVQLVLQGRLNHTLSQALNKPWEEAVWDYLAYWEMEGGVKIIGATEYSHQEAAELMRAAAQRLIERGETITPDNLEREINAV